MFELKRKTKQFASKFLAFLQRVKWIDVYTVNVANFGFCAGIFCVLAVKGCSNDVFGHVRRYGKSPCFLHHALCKVAKVDHVGYVFRHLNIHDLL